MSAATTTSRDLPPPQLTIEKPTVRAVLSLSLQLIAGLIQFGLQLGVFTVYMSQASRALCSAPPPNHWNTYRTLELRHPPPLMLPATPSPPSTPTSPSTLPPLPYRDDNQGSEVDNNGDIVETEEHGWSRADLTMSVLDMMAEEIEEIGGPAIAADAPVGDSTDSDSRRNRLSGQPHNPPLYELIHVRAFDWMEYVEDSQCGCIYHTEGYLWECMNTSDSRKWLRAGICTIGVDGAWLPHSFLSQEEAIIYFVHAVYAGVVEKQSLAQ
ncbi:hypothetical protein FIBSPDRAFT_902915 [Athelia psychrophila]|uniref:Uncharacterized protein n=1 Tax=Athelia psychrophila TaxID=1759441 RepID=A0A167WN30_9AGAM|nr:hypothetical protein FIBSPDRAFT_902915 [Fibularhizoctonia sp. CBS 109695]